MTEEQRQECRNMTEMNLKKELQKIINNYMIIYDEYYSTGSRESAFLKDLVDSLIGISAVLEVYVRDNKIYPDYAIARLQNSKSYLESTISFFEKLNINNLEIFRTCYACPEQYDVKYEGRLVGYLRLRNGYFYCDYISKDKTHIKIYESYPNGNGMFENDERDYYINMALNKIKEKILSEN